VNIGFLKGALLHGVRNIGSRAVRYSEWMQARRQGVQFLVGVRIIFDTTLSLVSYVNQG